MKRYAASFLRYLIFYSLGFLIFSLFGYFTRAFYDLLCEWFPSVFTSFGPIYDKNEYMEKQNALGLIGALLSLYTVTHLTTVYDNGRFEYMISRTDGFYTLGEGFSIYVKRYAAPDIISAVTVPALLAPLALITAPEDAPEWALRLIDLIDPFLSIQGAFCAVAGLYPGIILLILASVIFRAPTAFFGVKRFRGVWLSATEG